MLIVAILLLVSACSRDQAASETYTSPQAAVLAFVKAMNTQDSAAMIGLLSETTKEQVISKVTEVGGFISLFKYTNGMKMELTIVGIDSTSGKFTKVYTNQRIVKDSSINMKFDSIYFSAVNEDGGWKLLSLNARPDEKKVNP